MFNFHGTSDILTKYLLKLCNLEEWGDVFVDQAVCPEAFFELKEDDCRELGLDSDQIYRLLSLIYMKEYSFDNVTQTHTIKNKDKDKDKLFFSGDVVISETIKNDLTRYTFNQRNT